MQALQEVPSAASGSVAPASSISSNGEDITFALTEEVDAAASITLLAASPAADKSSSQAEKEQQPKEPTLDKQARFTSLPDRYIASTTLAGRVP